MCELGSLLSAKVVLTGTQMQGSEKDRKNDEGKLSSRSTLLPSPSRSFPRSKPHKPPPAWLKLFVTPKGDQSGRALKQILTPKRDHLKKKKIEERRKFDSCFSSSNSVFLRRTLNETLAA